MLFFAARGLEMELQGPERFEITFQAGAFPAPNLEIGVRMENRAPLLTTRHQPGLFEMKTKNSSLKENVYSKVPMNSLLDSQGHKMLYEGPVLSLELWRLFWEGGRSPR